MRRGMRGTVKTGSAHSPIVSAWRKARLAPTPAPVNHAYTPVNQTSIIPENVMNIVIDNIMIHYDSSIIIILIIIII
jgi:hypothetical protein